MGNKYLGSITLASVEDGEAGDLYRVESNYDFIYVVLHNVERSTSVIDVFSPSTVQFKVYKNDQSELLRPNNDYYYNFSFVGPDSIDLDITLPVVLPSDVSTTENDIVYFELEGLYDSQEEEPPQQSSLKKIYDACLAGNAFFTFNVYGDSTKTQVLTKHTFYLQNLLSASLASFETTANSIKMAVDQNSLRFDADGLTIYNGDLTIYDKAIGDADKKKVLYLDTSQNQLYIEGSGDFSGKITATEGAIGGLVIPSVEEGHGLRTNNNSFWIKQDGSGYIGGIVLENNGLHSENDNFSINADGSIIANDITLGSSAKIAQYIKLGSNDSPNNKFNASYIFNSDWLASLAGQVVIDEDFTTDGNAYFFSVGNKKVYLTADGIFRAGQIQIDGRNSSIAGTSHAENNAFLWPDYYITPEKAYFPNVEVSGKIAASVFEINHTQAVGGSMIYKPAFRIRNYELENELLTLTLENSIASFLSIVGYFLTEDNHFIEGKTYYTKNGDEYEVVPPGTIWDDTEKYYEYSTDLSLEEYVLIIDNNGNSITNKEVKLLEVDTTNNSIKVHFTGNFNDNLPVTCILMGKSDDIVIGINSTSASSDYMRSYGLTITKFTPSPYIKTTDETFIEGKQYYEYDENYYEYYETSDSTLQPDKDYYEYISNIPKVFLGDLAGANINFNTKNMKDADKRYGLYSDNVILNGTLTTIIDKTENKYAGVNTITGVNATIFEREGLVEPDTSKIVFWGGSEGSDPENITKAPFQVTENGSLYASQGLFAGAIITDSEIHGADIFAARIHGTNGGNNGYGLAIYDTSQGILFRQGGSPANWDDAIDVFSIRTDGFSVSTNKFIQIGEAYNSDNISPNVNFYGKNLKIDNNIDTKNINMLQGLFKYTINDTQCLQMDSVHHLSLATQTLSTTNYTGLDFGQADDNTLGNSINLKINSTNKLNITNVQTSLNTDVVQVHKDFNLSNTMKYEKQQQGYDLYISQ